VLHGLPQGGHRTGPPAAVFGHPGCPLSLLARQPRRSEAGTATGKRAHPGSIGPATDLVSLGHPL
ncbi:hypothetical protein, partial [Streptomyces sp. NPDC056660]|uniref:hypothetical protein n=1 Tax=Streptomyces sp. NPDC056660 TaxID=3345897 RepID=UPI0036C8A6A7